jgi:restriction endonuclease S subunit
MLKRGGSVDPSRFVNETFELLSIPAFDKGVSEIVEGRNIGSSKKCVEPNDILLSKIVPHIRRCWVVPPIGKYRQIASGEWIQFRSDRLHSEYLKFFLISDPFHCQFMSTVSGIGGSLLRASPSQVAKIKIPVPPLAEQQKIVSVLNAADSLRQKDQQLIDKYNVLSQSLFLEMFGDPVSNPMGWEVKLLKNLSIKISSGNTPKGGSKVYVDEGISFYRSQNVWRNKIVLNDIAYIDNKTHEEMKKTSLKNRDILMTKTGRFNTENSSLGRAALFIGEDDSANVNGHVYLIRLQEKIINEFVLFILTTHQYREYIRSVCVGGIDKRQINKEHLENFPIIFPPSKIQQYFTERLALIEAQKQLAQASLKKSEALFNSLLQRAFKGQLTA